MEKKYRAIWADYIQAKVTLTDTVNAYTSFAKFEKDFPDLAKYMPRPVVTKTSVQVQVGDVMKKLTKVGIPPSVKEEA